MFRPRLTKRMGKWHVVYSTDGSYHMALLIALAQAWAEYLNSKEVASG
jgi:hypothetical protein